MIEDIEIIVGTYEEFLLGYKPKLTDGKYSLLPTFSTKSHTASVRSVAISGKYLASGGGDDKIFLYDMEERKEIQILINHEGTVNTVKFTPDSKYLLSGGEDGHMFATRIGSWRVDGNWEKAHDGSPIKYIACHPSGNLVLSLGQDLFVRTWNLSTGRCAFKTNLKSKEHFGNIAEFIEWSPNGKYFLLSGLKVVELVSVEDKKTTKIIKTKSKPTCGCWLSDQIFAIGLEGGEICLSTTDKNDEDKYIKVDDKRVKCMVCHNEAIAIASSSGEISLWKVNLNNLNLKKIVSLNIGCRPTCLALLNLNQFKNSYLLTEPKVIEESKEVKQSYKKPKDNFKNSQRVTVEYQDESDTELNGKGKINENDESDDNENNNAGAFVRINKNRKNENKISNKAKEKIKVKKPRNKINKLKIAKEVSKDNIKKKLKNKKRKIKS